MRFKALVHVRLRGSVSDAAGNAVMNNTQRVTPNHQPHLLRIGKCIDFWFDAESEEVARKELDELSDKLFANTVIEDWEQSDEHFSSLHYQQHLIQTLLVLQKLVL